MQEQAPTESTLQSQRYQKDADRFTQAVLLTSLATMVALLLTDLSVNIISTHYALLLPAVVANIGLIVVFRKGRFRSYVGHLTVAVQYLIIEIHQLNSPWTLHGIMYWFCVIPVIALLTTGIKGAKMWLGIVLLTIILNTIIIYYTTGLTYQIKIGLLPSVAIGIIFITMVFVSNYLLFERLSTAYTEMKERNAMIKALHHKAESRNQKFETYQQAIYTLTKHIALFNGDMQESYQAICSQAALAMQISRVSIWELSSDNNYMTRRCLYHANKSTTENALLYRKETPNYFNAIINRQFIAAQYASTHPDTHEFRLHYLEPLHIISMLDAPIDIDGEVYGVICCEHQHNAIDWQAEDIMFVQMLSGLVAQSIKSERINKLLTQVHEQNNDLKERNAEILTLNEELQSMMEQLRLSNQQLEVILQERTEQNEHISALNTQLSSSLEKIQLMNEELERRVAERTSTLEQQNAQLNEYAFINSHLLRAPLSRILGLAHLITDNNGTADISIVQALVSSCDELDNIIRKISELLYEGNNFSRADIKAIIQRNLNVNK